ncbi:MAG TPA: MMPL family transporter [Solirubrobacteraceae bacterium]|nr:MMPL family transporter [Solirubrobacteraceae bacterium]
MLGLTRWCISHRRTVILGWIAIAVIATLVAQAVGRQYASNFTLPGTESQHVVNLLNAEFKSQAGDLDQIVWHTSTGTVNSPAVRQAVQRVLTEVGHMPHVVSVTSPYGSAGAFEISQDRRTAFANVAFDKRANQLPNATGKPILNAIKSVSVPGLKMAAGGQVIEEAEGFSIGPATAVGVLAALVILLITFGSLISAGLPLITAGFGLITGVALIGLATHLTSLSNVSPQLALMIGLGVGVDYALFIVTRFKESFRRTGNVEHAVLEAMDTSGRAILLAGTTVVIALLGMFATGVSFMYGLAIASVLAVLLTLLASITVLPAMLSRVGHRLGRSRKAAAATANGLPARESLWRRWSLTVQARPWPLALVSLAVMVAFLLPVTGLRLENSDAGNDPSNTITRQAFDLLAQGFGPGFNGPLAVVVPVGATHQGTRLASISNAVAATPDVARVTSPQLSPSGRVALIRAYPGSAPQDPATTALVNRLRQQVLPPLRQQLGVPILVGGFTAGSIDFSHVLSSKLPLFIGLVVVLSALLLFVIFRSLVIPLQAAVMNLLSIGGALGATVLVFQKGWLAGVFGLQKGPVEPWVPLLMFAVVFGLSMDYEVFLVSRIREEWVRHGDARLAVADGLAFTGRVITAAAAIMICVFLSFFIGNQRTLKEFGFGLATAVFLDAVVIRCVMVPAVLELLGALTWELPTWIDRRLPHFRIEGSPEISAGFAVDGQPAVQRGEPEAEPEKVAP